MLIKDKDILVNEITSTTTTTSDKELNAQRSKEYKAHMHEAWGDAFDYFLVGVTSKYLEFRGRATRLELWGFAVATMLVFFALYFLGSYIDMKMLPYYYLMSTAIPTMAVLCRRIHDLNRSAFWHLGVEILLIVLSIFFGSIPCVLALVWGGYLVILFSKPSDLEEGIYGDPNDEDEIYGLDNEKIINKFRFLSLAMLLAAICLGLLEFDSWNRNMQQNLVVTDIMETLSNKAVEKGYNTQEISLATNEMRKILKMLGNKEVSEEELQKYIDEALNVVRNEKTPN